MKNSTGEKVKRMRSRETDNCSETRGKSGKKGKKEQHQRMVAIALLTKTASFIRK